MATTSRAASPFARRLAGPPGAGRPRRQGFAIAGVVLVAAILAGTALLLRPSGAEEGSKVVAAYVTDLPGGCEAFRLRMAGAFAGAEGIPLPIVLDSVVLSDHHGAAEGVKVAEGRVPRDLEGRIDLVVAGAECRKGEDWSPVRIPKSVLSVQAAIPPGTTGSSAAVFDFKLDESLVIRTGERGEAVVEFEPRVEVQTVVVRETDYKFPIDFGLLMERIERLEVAVERSLEVVDGRLTNLEELTQSVIDRICLLERECALRTEAPLGGLPTGEPRPTSPTPAPPAPCLLCLPPPVPPPPNPGTDPTNHAPTTPAAPAPAHAARVAEAAALAWAPSSDPDGDPITYDVTLDGSVACSNAPAPTCSVATLPIGSSHAWSVVAKDGRGGTAPSASWTFTVNAPPGAATAPNPAHGATGLGSSLALAWTAGSDPDAEAVQHRVLVGTTNPPTLEGCPLAAAATCALAGLAPGSTQYWRVVTTDGSATVEGPVWDFRVNAPPTTPFDLWATNNGPLVYFGWNGGDPDNGPSPVTYTVAFMRNGPGGASPGESCEAPAGTTSCTANLNPPLPGTWSMYVRAYDGSQTVTSPSRTFAVTAV